MSRAAALANPSVTKSGPERMPESQQARSLDASEGKKACMQGSPSGSKVGGGGKRKGRGEGAFSLVRVSLSLKIYK